MKSILLVLMLAMLCGVASAAWHDDWDYRTPIEIDGNTEDLTNYQVNIILQGTNPSSDNYVNFDMILNSGTDIRFTDSDQTTEIDFWIEEWNDAVKNAIIWANVSSILQAGTKTIYVYYGKAGANNGGDGDGTFELFDDFDGIIGYDVIQPTQPWETGYQLRWGSIAVLDGIYYIYYTSGSTASSDVGRATSDTLATWTKAISNPIIDDVIGPSLLKELDGKTPIVYDSKYWMATCTSDCSKIQVRSAPTIDSDTWTVENDIAITPQPGTWYDTGVLTCSFTETEEDGTYYIVFQGYNGSNWKIGYATASSPDGPYDVKEVLLQSSLAWEGSHIVDPEMRKFGGTYYLFYTGNAGINCYNSYATSATINGTYVKSDIRITPKGFSYPAILMVDSIYYLIGDNLNADGQKDLYKRADLNGEFSLYCDNELWHISNVQTDDNVLSINGAGSIKSVSEFGTNTSMRTNISFVAYADYLQIGYNNVTDTSTINQVGMFGYSTPTIKAISSVSGGSSSTTDLGNMGTEYHVWDVTRGNGKNNYTKDGENLAYHTTDVFTGDTNIVASVTNSAGHIKSDWVLVRKYMFPEPTSTTTSAFRGHDNIFSGITNTISPTDYVSYSAEPDVGNLIDMTSVPTSTLTINVTTFSEPLKRYNESAASNAYALYTVGECDADTSYVVNIFADINSTKMQTFPVESNSTGYITYNATGYGYDRWTEITPLGDSLTYSTHLSALTPGTAGNSITTTTTCADASWDAATLTGGSDSDSEWAGSDVPTGVDIWRDGAGMIAIVVLALLAGVVIVFLRGGGSGIGSTISPNAAIGLAVGLLVLLAVFSIAPIFGDKIDSVSDLGQETHATGRLTFVLDGTITDGETVTIDATPLEFDRAADGVTAGRVPVNVSDGSTATASLNLTAAINGNATLAAVVAARRDVST